MSLRDSYESGLWVGLTLEKMLWYRARIEKFHMDMNVRILL